MLGRITETQENAHLSYQKYAWKSHLSKFLARHGQIFGVQNVLINTSSKRCLYGWKNEVKNKQKKH